MEQLSGPRVVVLVSGAGTTFVALAEAAAAGRLPARFVGVIADRTCPALAKARDLNVESILVERRAGDAAWEGRLVAAVDSFKPDFVLLAGFLRKVPLAIIRDYAGRIFNSHPALLPKYGGKGMYGGRVHEAVIASGDKETGVTLHHVTENYDEGAPLAQVRLTIRPGETAAELEERVKAIEKEFLITELQKLWSEWTPSR